MAENSYKGAKPGKGFGRFRIFDGLNKLEPSFEKGLPVRYLPYLLYISAIAIFYIGNSHYAEKNIREISRVKQQVEDLRADFTTLKSEYMFQSKLSEVAKRVDDMGLKASMDPPNKIVKEEEK